MATENKYDRQIRLWGAHGQKDLAESKICLVGSTGLGTETLKNLVLPGIGHVTILDDAVVTENDMGNNFFVTKDDLGQNRAEVTLKWLLELNPDSDGASEVANISDKIKNNPEYFNQFNLIIGSQLCEEDARGLSQLTEANGHWLMLIRAYGLLSYIRIYTPEHRILEKKEADKEIDDLRLVAPFPELVAYCDSMDMATMDDMHHRHTPYVVILYKELQIWKAAHEGALPSSFAEKEEFRNQIRASSRDFNGSENFQEAVNNAYKAYVPDVCPDDTNIVLADDSANNLGEGAKRFWIAAKALNDFVAEKGLYPMTGIFPDMTADTQTYIDVQAIYAKKAQEDLDWMVAKCQSYGMEDVDYVGLFCKNWKQLELVRYRSLNQEYNEPNKDDLMMEWNDDESLVMWYIGLRACDRFRTANGRYPGTIDAEIEADNAAVKELGQAVITELGGEVDFPEGYAQEMVRYGAGEIHNIDAFLGGIASQEAVKLITRQYTPINNTFLYTGTYSRGQTFEF